MINQAVTHESAAVCPGKEWNSQNKQKLQTLSIQLQKQLNPSQIDFESLDVLLKDIIKVMEMRTQGDLHVFRKLKFIPLLIDIC